MVKTLSQKYGGNDMDELEKAISCTKKMKEYFSITLQNANVDIPKDIVIGTNEHLIYIFYSCLLDYGIRSKTYHTNLIHTFEKDKEIFDPKYVVEHYENNELELLKVIKNNIHPRYPNIALKKWIYLSKFLYTNYPDDQLRTKIVSLQSYRELYDFILQINGYGQKTGGLLFRLICEAKICQFDDEIQEIPIDRHDIEISYLNGIIQKETLNKEEIKKLSRIWIEAANRNDISPFDMDKYLWSIGNQLCSKKKCDICPINMNCRRKDQYVG